MKSRKIVVIGRPGALQSEWVRREVALALAHRKISVTANLNGAVEPAPEDAVLASMAREAQWLRLTETLAGPDGDPSDKMISELVRSFNHTRHETKRQRVFATAATVFALTAQASLKPSRSREPRLVIGNSSRRVELLSLQSERERSKLD